MEKEINTVRAFIYFFLTFNIKNRKKKVLKLSFLQKVENTFRHLIFTRSIARDAIIFIAHN